MRSAPVLEIQLNFVAQLIPRFLVIARAERIGDISRRFAQYRPLC